MMLMTFARKLHGRKEQPHGSTKGQLGCTEGTALH